MSLSARAVLSTLIVTGLAVPTFAGLPGPSGTSATPANNSHVHQSMTTLNRADDVFDYQVWAAVYEVNWYVIVTYRDGYVSEIKRSSEESALEQAAWLWFHIVEIDSIDIEPREELSAFIYIETFDTSSAANQLAVALEQAGLVTDIRKIRQRSRRTRQLSRVR